MATELAEGKSKTRLPGDGRGAVGANKSLSKLNITPTKPKTLMSPAASASRDNKLELKVKKLGLPWWSSG